MEKRRIGNDFKHVWAINWNGLPEDFSDATEIVLTASVFGKKTILERGIDYVIEGNLIIVDFTPRFATIAGIYNLELKYIKPSDGFIDGERRSAVDIDVVQIVSKSSQVTATGDITSTSEAMTGFQGLSAYEVWLKDNPDKTKEDYYNWLRQPATDAAESLSELEQTVSGNEALRVTAEQGRSDAELLRVGAEGIRNSNEIDRIEAEGIRDANETARINAESDRVDAEDLRELAEVAREEAEGLRQTNTATAIQNAGLATTAANTAAGLANNAATAANTAAGAANNAAEAANTAAGLANNAATTANTAAGLADDAREAIQDDLALKANHGYDSSPKTLKEVDDEKANHGYASIAVAKTLKEVEDNASVKIENLVVNGDFRNGLNGWIVRGNHSTSTVIGGVLNIVATGDGGLSSEGDIFKTIPRVSGNIYYTTFMYKNNGGDTCTLNVNTITGRKSRVISDTYQKHIIVETPSVSSTAYLHIYATGVTSGANILFDNFMIINLTQTFGAGNEPTKEEFELLLDILGIDYFEGEITIPAQKIMQWQLALIRKNKNAIIALGGTII